jgi:membrane associated rhomboid family serine protease
MEISITLILVAITVLISVVGFKNRSFKEKLLFNSYLFHHERQYYRLFSHAFIHSGWMHLLVNMWVLYIFGQFVEAELTNAFPFSGRISFVLLYVGGIAFASSSALVKHKDNIRYNSLGASGAVAAVLYAFIIMRPTHSIYLYFMIGLPAFLFGVLYLWYEYSMDKRSKGILFMLVIDYNYLIECYLDIKFYISSFLT